jgi:hypothetical protein
MFVQELEESGADGRWHSQDDSFRDAVDGIGLTIVSGVEEMIGGFFEL